MQFLYQLLIALFISVYFPVFVFQYLVRGKYKGKLKEKLGLKNYLFKQGSPTIWVHAVSVGEVKAVSSLLKQLKNIYPDSSIIVSSITETGYKEAQKCTPFADHHILMPVDLKCSLKTLLKGLKIDLVLLVETDIWPNFLQECKKRGAQIVLINGKISERSYTRLKKIRLFADWYLSAFDFMLVQDALYQQRFIDLGFSKDKISVIPNLKLDDTYPDLSKNQLNQLKKKFGIEEGCLTIGSSHAGEEEAILEAIAPLLIQNPRLKILLVPRHPERANEVESILKRMNLSYGRYSQNGPLFDKKVILIDTMGFLRTCYQLSEVAIVAGSFTSKVGGHNILEPLWYSTPCVFGPFMHTQSQFVHLVQQANAGDQVGISDLKQTMEELFENSSKRTKMGSNGRAIFDKASGGTKLTVNFIKKTLADNSKDM